MEKDIQITVADLATLKNLIEVATSRGAFKADELSTVGQTYDKLHQFLDKIVKEAERNKETPIVNNTGDTQ